MSIKIASLLVGAALLGAALGQACKEEQEPPADECEQGVEGQCPPGTGCKLAHDHLACVTQCQDDDGCPDGQVCDWGGASCPQCLDMFKICQDPPED